MQVALSYMPARDLFEFLGTARLNRTSFKMACVRVLGGLVYDGIACPAGTFRRPRPDVAAACAARNLSCAASAAATVPQTCLCQPCRAAEEVEIWAAALPLAAPEGTAMPQVLPLRVGEIAIPVPPSLSRPRAPPCPRSCP